MIFAFDESKNRINALYADKSKEYTCPVCNCKVIPRQGEHNIFHFSHPKGNECDSWNYDMSEWHRSWQNQFPEETQEIVLSVGKEKHRADILLEDKKMVIEFQHSNLSSDEFNERNDFYTSLGYEVIWLFDLSEKNIEPTNTSHQYKWKWGSSTFCDFYPPKEKKIIVYFQFEDAPFDDDFDDGVIEKLTWIPEYTEKVNIFRTEDWMSLSPFEFVDLLKKGTKITVEPSKSNSSYDCYIPQDRIYGLEFDLIMRNKESRSFDDVKLFVRESVNKIIRYVHCGQNVEVLNSSILNNNRIKYRIKAFFANEINLSSSDCIKEIEDSFKIGCSEEARAENFYFFGKTIPDIMKNLSSFGAGVINLRTGKDFYVPNSEYFKKEKIYYVKGKPKLSFGNKYSSNFWEIYDALKPEWILKFS